MTAVYLRVKENNGTLPLHVETLINLVAISGLTVLISLKRHHLEEAPHTAHGMKLH